MDPRRPFADQKQPERSRIERVGGHGTESDGRKAIGKKIQHCGVVGLARRLFREEMSWCVAIAREEIDPAT